MFTNAARTTAKESPTILERIANNDQTAVTECLRAHGNWIWSYARKNSDSKEAAEGLTMNIFHDICRYAHRFKPAGLEEKTFLALIARRRVRGRPAPAKMNIAPDNKFYRSFQTYAKIGER